MFDRYSYSHGHATSNSSNLCRILRVSVCLAGWVSAAGSSAAGSLSSLLWVDLDLGFQSNRRRHVPSYLYFYNCLSTCCHSAVTASEVGTDWTAWQVAGSQ